MLEISGSNKVAFSIYLPANLYEVIVEIAEGRDQLPREYLLDVLEEIFTPEIHTKRRVRHIKRKASERIKQKLILDSKKGIDE